MQPEMFWEIWCHWQHVCHCAWWVPISLLSFSIRLAKAFKSFFQASWPFCECYGICTCGFLFSGSQALMHGINSIMLQWLCDCGDCECGCMIWCEMMIPLDVIPYLPPLSYRQSHICSPDITMDEDCTVLHLLPCTTVTKRPQPLLRILSECFVDAPPPTPCCKQPDL